MALFGEKKKEFEALPEGSVPKVAIQLENGSSIVLELFSDVAPQHVASFVDLVSKGFYDGLNFHRVVPGFVVQGGCPKGTGLGGPGYRLKAEFNAKPHLSGSLAMARSSDPDSAGSQFYICLEPQPSLDGNYTVFGQVIEGFEEVKKIRQGDKMSKIELLGR